MAQQINHVTNAHDSSSKAKDGSRKTGHNVPKYGTRKCQGTQHDCQCCQPCPCVKRVTQSKANAPKSTPSSAHVRPHMAKWLPNQPLMCNMLVRLPRKAVLHVRQHGKDACCVRFAPDRGTRACPATFKVCALCPHCVRAPRTPHAYIYATMCTTRSAPRKS